MGKMDMADFAKAFEMGKASKGKEASLEKKEDL